MSNTGTVEQTTNGTMDTSAAPAVQAPSPSPGLPSGDWRSALPEELRNEKSLAQVRDIPSLAKGYVESQKLVGGSVRMPKEDAKPEEWDAFYAKLGRPASADKYELPEPGNGKSWDKETLGKYLPKFHAAGYTPKQVQVAMNAFHEYMLAAEDYTTQQTAQQQKAAQAELVKEWGPADGPVYQRNLAAAREVAVKLFEAEGADLDAIVGQLGNNVGFLRGMVKAAQWGKEDGLITGEPVYGASQDEAKRKISEIRTSERYLKSAPGSQARKAVDAELESYYKVAFGTGPRRR